MKKWTFLFLSVIMSFSIAFASEDMEDDYSYVIDENYDYSLGYGDSSDDTLYENVMMKGVVVEAGEVYNFKDIYSDIAVPTQDLKVRILDDRLKDKILDIQYSLSYYADDVIVADPLKVGNRVYVYANFENGEMVGVGNIGYVDKERPIVILGVLFAAAIVLIGGVKGIKALVSLAITICALFFFMIPKIFSGANALLISIVTSVGIIIISLVIISGFNRKTLCAVLGTSAGIILAGVLAVIFGNIMKLSGVDEESYMLTTAGLDTVFNFKNIMFAGIIIGALGACMDIGLSLSSAMYELKKESVDISGARLFKAGMNIGKDMMGTMTNTLILAYIGSSMCIILLFMGFNFQMFEIINQEKIAEEFLRSLAGSLGLVCTIPLTALFCSIIYSGMKSKE